MSDIDLDKLVSLLSEYDAANAKVAELQEQVVAAIRLRSGITRAILEANGGKKKLRRSGKELSIVTRGDTCFFRGAKEGDNITEV